MKKIIKNVITILMTIIILVTNICPTRVIASNNNAAITKQVHGFMSSVKRYNHKKINKYLVDKKYPFILDKKLNKFISKVNKEHLNYEIKSIHIKGKSATVKIHISFYSLYEDCRAAMAETILEYKKSWSSNKSINTFTYKLMDEYETSNYYSDFIESNTFSLNLTLKFKKNGKKWKIEKIPPKKDYFLDASLYDFLLDFSKNPKIAMGWR